MIAADNCQRCAKNRHAPMNRYFLQPSGGCPADIIDGEEQETNHDGKERERIPDQLQPDDAQQED